MKYEAINRMKAIPRLTWHQHSGPPVCLRFSFLFYRREKLPCAKFVRASTEMLIVASFCEDFVGSVPRARCNSICNGHFWCWTLYRNVVWVWSHGFCALGMCKTRLLQGPSCLQSVLLQARPSCTRKGKKGSVVQLSTSLAPRSGDIGGPQLHVFQDFRRENVQQIPDAIRRSGVYGYQWAHKLGHFRDEIYETMIFFCILSPWSVGESLWIPSLATTPCEVWPSLLRWLVEITRWGVKDGDLTDGSTIQYEWVTIWRMISMTSFTIWWVKGMRRSSCMGHFLALASAQGPKTLHAGIVIKIGMGILP